MKIIHCADVHLDSVLTSTLPSEKAKERRNELLLTFERMIAFAAQEEVRVILLAGDLFDTKNTTARTRNAVLKQILEHPEIDFHYLRGNHDTESFLGTLTEIPANLRLYGERWISYPYGKVVISAIELTPENSPMVYNSLMLLSSDYNIVMMHGQEIGYMGKDRAEEISLVQLHHKSIDYLALGHIHEYKEGKLDRRGDYCYCGCLEGRGFDECGKKGFVLLDLQISEDETVTCTRKFIPFAERTLHEVIVDITGTETTYEVSQRIEEALQKIPSKDLVKVLLTGRVRVVSECNISYLTTRFEKNYYHFRIKEQIGLLMEPEEFRYDASLKGELIRLVLSQDMSEQTKKEIIETGLKALAGEDLSE